MTTQEEFWQKLQAKICVKCLDGDGLGNCRLGGDDFCAMKANLPVVLDLVRSVQSDSIVPYEEQLRKRICAVCEMQLLENGCLLRKEVNCALDRYFPLIVEVIEETQMRH